VPIWSEVLANVYLWQQTKQKQITMTTEEKGQIREAVHNNYNDPHFEEYVTGIELTNAVCEIIYNGDLNQIFYSSDNRAILAEDVWANIHFAIGNNPFPDANVEFTYTGTGGMAKEEEMFKAQALAENALLEKEPTSLHEAIEIAEGALKGTEHEWMIERHSANITY